jgi:hypothetical protein
VFEESEENENDEVAKRRTDDDPQEAEYVETLEDEGAEPEEEKVSRKAKSGRTSSERQEEVEKAESEDPLAPFKRPYFFERNQDEREKEKQAQREKEEQKRKEKEAKNGDVEKKQQKSEADILLGKELQRVLKIEAEHRRELEQALRDHKDAIEEGRTRITDAQIQLILRDDPGYRDDLEEVVEMELSYKHHHHHYHMHHLEKKNRSPRKLVEVLLLDPRMRIPKKGHFRANRIKQFLTQPYLSEKKQAAKKQRSERNLMKKEKSDENNVQRSESLRRMDSSKPGSSDGGIAPKMHCRDQLHDFYKTLQKIGSSHTGNYTRLQAERTAQRQQAQRMQQLQQMQHLQQLQQKGELSQQQMQQLQQLQQMHVLHMQSKGKGKGKGMGAAWSRV